MCVAVCRALFDLTPYVERDALARRMADVKSEISRILYVKCPAFLASKDDFLVSA